jgi:hypothetical protein
MDLAQPAMTIATTSRESVAVTARRALRRHSLSYLLRWGVGRVWGGLTADWRVLPDFMIIGAQRCGTTSLFRYLTQHPAILASLPKEVHFFSNHYHRGLGWYQSHFPLAAIRRVRDRIRGGPSATGEATPYYLAHPHAPGRAAATVPHARLIVLLRNPIDRAHSHYHYEVQWGFEDASFEDALSREAERVDGEEIRMQGDQTYRSLSHQHFSYLSRGIYVDQLARWADLFGRHRMLVLQSERFYRDPPAALAQVVDFLGLPPWDFNVGVRHNATRYDGMDPATRERLIDYFEPFNKSLYEFLGTNYDWDK